MDSGGGAALGYADSVDSSPRSRGAESWDEPYPSGLAPSSKLRLMCSYGGRIVPRPTDKSLCYLGGETRIVVVDRHSSLADLYSRLSGSLLGGHPFLLKYQLPSEDLDSLISVAIDEDLENMIEEYDRLLLANPNPSRSSRIRLFLFPAKPESTPSSIGSLLGDSKSETWFFDALNSAMGAAGLPDGLSTDSASVNCLLGLEDDSSVHSRSGGAPPLEEEHIVLQRSDEAPMLETSSSFGSASSAPSLSSLPPIRLRPEDRPPDPRTCGLNDQFSQMNIAPAHLAAAAAAPLVPATASTPNISPTENPNRVFSDDERFEKSDQVGGGGIRSAPAAAPPHQQPWPKIEALMPDSVARPMYAVNPITDTKRETLLPDQNYQMPPPASATAPPSQIQASEESYILPDHFPQHQQFIHANAHYIHHPATGTMLPLQSYYQIPHSLHQSQHQTHHLEPQIPMYYLPVHPNPNHHAIPTPPAPIVHATTDQSQAYAAMGYHLLHHHHPSQYADQSHVSMYYAQAASTQQVMRAQYQTTAAPPGTIVTEAQLPPEDAMSGKAS